MSPPVGNPRRNARKRIPPTRRRALELLAGSRDGATEAIMLAHGFAPERHHGLVAHGIADYRKRLLRHRRSANRRVLAGGIPLGGNTTWIGRSLRRSKAPAKKVSDPS